MGVVGFYIAEYVGVAEDELGVERVGHVGYVKQAFLVGNLGVEEHMEQHIAQLLAYLGTVVVEQSLA